MEQNGLRFWMNAVRGAGPGVLPSVAVSKPFNILFLSWNNEQEAQPHQILNESTWPFEKDWPEDECTVYFPPLRYPVLRPSSGRAFEAILSNSARCEQQPVLSAASSFWRLTHLFCLSSEGLRIGTWVAGERDLVTCEEVRPWISLHFLLFDFHPLEKMISCRKRKLSLKLSVVELTWKCLPWGSFWISVLVVVPAIWWKRTMQDFYHMKINIFWKLDIL